ncbi:glycosyltransferase family 2 protein [Phycisphaera mikurensis]|uniref:Putative glycosyltransferase n=1 Tax=Phycisphaera mikurensis (strain NBRC 102666 / KCTC 22515 / FYK2301M01) TaxID=1142394 RepID=I0IBC3_PHYMF|nr:glycosyltransferase [Phycisphaera mikurensis]MBB6443055.1 GT2 family glycosyltransferase [Phycisphaera mikurensis]BAM02561.1 putative glycosyltransferase [Phycisphaera mikurensis NBRC 102666]
MSDATPQTAPAPRIGLVAIGRNEGDRLRDCLDSVLGEGADGRWNGQPEAVVYVDSGSTDGSVELAESRGASVVELDTSIPFTAARARNEGRERLREVAPDLGFVQFVDGDCTLRAGWLEAAAATLAAEPDVAVVCGRRRERFPQATRWNKLCDMEWDTPVGEAAACGGDALYRLPAFDAVGGFDPTFICGEEPQLCLRLRRAGHRVLRIDQEMTLHDAAMTSWRQWWKRSTRGGWAYAEGADRYGNGPEAYNVKQDKSNVFWAWVFPAIVGVSTLLGLFFTLWSLLLLLLIPAGYAVLAWRVRGYRIGRGDGPRDALSYGVLTALGKFPSAAGHRRYFQQQRRGGPATLIEYKPSGAAGQPEAG